MNIYSNSFFQRVRNCNTIKLILAEGFKAFYCKEEIITGSNSSMFIGIPMVCFCDIPLVYLSKNKYGHFGIAMSRKWGKKRHLEPVLYYPNDTSCQSTKMIIKAAHDFITYRKNANAYRILGYAKPMTKPTTIKGKNSDNYVEREWRKVYANPSPLKWLTEDEYNNYRGDKANEKSAVGTPLHFKVSDIDFILTEKNSVKELQKFIMEDLQKIGGNDGAITPYMRYALLSKILVYEDIIHNL